MLLCVWLIYKLTTTAEKLINNFATWCLTSVGCFSDVRFCRFPLRSFQYINSNLKTAPKVCNNLLIADSRHHSMAETRVPTYNQVSTNVWNTSKSIHQRFSFTQSLILYAYFLALLQSESSHPYLNVSITCLILHLQPLISPFSPLPVVLLWTDPLSKLLVLKAGLLFGWGDSKNTHDLTMIDDLLSARWS